MAIGSSSKALANKTNIIINNHLISVELAISAAERNRGLMHRKSLAENSGMLFVYSEPKIVSFWMKKTLIALDLIFFDRDGQIIEIRHNIQPCKTKNCKTYTNNKPAKFVLELAAGTAKKLQLELKNKFHIIK